MRYLDLDKKEPLPSPEKKGRFRRIPRRAILVGVVAILAGLIYAVYALFWPAQATLADLFNAPAAVLSFIRPPEASLKSTDGRTNILLVGIDRRANEPYSYTDRSGKTHRNCFRADTLIVASVNLTARDKDVVFISVPRDLWVPIPGWTAPGTNYKFPAQQNKINATYCFGDRDGYPSGFGLGLARDTMEKILGIRIHYAVRIDFYGFKKIVDAVGGISLDVPYSFTDCSYPTESYGYKCVTFKKGFQYLSADRALEYARSRHATAGGDLDRARRQQQVLLAVRDKALSLPVLADPLKVSALVKGLAETIQTLDVDFSQVGQFYKLIQGVTVDSTQNIVLTNDPKSPAGLLVSGNSANYGGASVFIPRAGQGNFTDIKAYVARILAEATLKQSSSSAEPK